MSSHVPAAAPTATDPPVDPRGVRFAAALTEKVKAMTRSTSPIQIIPYDQAYEAGFEDMPRRVPDISKIREMIGYEPKLDLDQIIHTVIEHIRAS